MDERAKQIAAGILAGTLSAEMFAEALKDFPCHSNAELIRFCVNVMDIVRHEHVPHSRGEVGEMIIGIDEMLAGVHGMPP